MSASPIRAGLVLEWDDTQLQLLRPVTNGEPIIDAFTKETVSADNKHGNLWWVKKRQGAEESELVLCMFNWTPNELAKVKAYYV